MCKVGSFSCVDRLRSAFSKLGLEQTVETAHHFPICLEEMKLDRGKTPFGFGNMWQEVEGFADVIKSGGKRLSSLALLALLLQAS